MQLRFDSQRSVYYCESSYEERMIPKTAGFLWDAVRKRWWTKFPNKAHRLSEYADSDTQKIIEREKGKEELESFVRSKAAGESRATDNTEIVIPVPDGLEYMPFQRAGIAYAIARMGVLVADEMGLGKTIQAIGVINFMKARNVLIVCPASLKINWNRELEKWLVGDLSIGIANGKFPKTDVVIVNYDVLKKYRKWIMERDWDVLILDEGHYIKNLKAQRTKLAHEIAQRVKRRIILTGTPILNRPVELFSLLSWLDPIRWNNFFRYAKRYCAPVRNHFGWDFSGASNLEELNKILRESIMVRRLKKDVLVDLPDKTRQIIDVPVNGMEEQVRKEQKLETQHDEVLSNLRADVVIAAIDENEDAYRLAVDRLKEARMIAFEEIARVRHETAVMKVPCIIEHVREALESANKVVLFAHHKDVIKSIKDGLSTYNPVSLTGEDSQQERQNAVDSFQNKDDIRLFIGSIKAAGVGLTLTASSTVIFAELDWTPGSMTQAEDRCHRIGQKSNVLVQHLVVDGSSDSRLAKVLIKKQAVIEQALDRKQENEEQIDINEDQAMIITMSRAKEAERVFTEDQKKSIHKAIRILSGMCDGARSRDDMGFNRFDSRIGQQLASLNELNDKEAAIAYRIASKYHRQIGKLEF